MSEPGESDVGPSPGGIVKLGEGDELRHVERDVIIPKIMKARAMKLCSEYVQGSWYTASGNHVIYSLRVAGANSSNLTLWYTGFSMVSSNLV